MEGSSIHKYANRVLQHVRADRIDLGEYDDPNIAFILWDGTMFLSRHCSEEEHIKTILHEAVHLDDRFISYTRSIWLGKGRRDDVIEAEIDGIAQRIYKERSDIVEAVRDKLRDAYLDPANLSCGS